MPTFLKIHKAKFPKFSIFVGQRSILRHYCNQNVTDEIEIRAYEINKKCYLF